MARDLVTLVVYPYLHHYRRGVFQELDESRGHKFIFASDLVGRLGIVPLSPDVVKNFVRVRTRRLGRIEYQSGLLRYLIRNQYDNVIFLGDVSSLSTWAGAIVGRLKGARVLFWTIGWHRPERGIKRLLRVAFYRLAHDLLLYGQIGKQIGLQMGFPEAQMHVIGNSVSAPEDASPGRLVDLPTPFPGTVWVGAVARITRVKRFDLLIDACAVLRSEGIDARVLLVGSGPETASLEQTAEDLDVPLVLCGPAYSKAQLAQVYEVLDITVVPAAVGLTAVQSLAFGTPVLSDNDTYSQMPEWESIRSGVTGEIYQVGDVAGLAHAIKLTAGRLNAELDQVRDDCKAEYRARWNPRVHASRIVRVLESRR